MIDTTPTSKVRTWRLLSWPNRISLLRLLLVAPFVLLLLYQRVLPWGRYAALATFVVMGISDLIDGLLARRLTCRTRLGAILDPLADKISIVCAVILLSHPGAAVPGAQLPRWVAVAVVGKDLWVVIGFLVVYLATDHFHNQPTWSGKVCTVGQIVMVGFTLLAPELNWLSPGLGGRIVTGLSAAVMGLCILAVISYTRLGLRFIATEGKPLEEVAPPELQPHEHD